MLGASADLSPSSCLALTPDGLEDSSAWPGIGAPPYSVWQPTQGTAGGGGA